MRCGFCGCENIEEAVFCERCGKKLEILEEEQVVDKTQRIEPKINIKVCPFCGAENLPEAIFCLECGKKLQQTKEPQTPPTPKKSARPQARPAGSRATKNSPNMNRSSRKRKARKKTRTGLIICLGLLGIIAVLGIVFSPKLLKNLRMRNSETTTSANNMAVVIDNNDTTESAVITPIPTSTPVPTPFPTATPTPIPTRRPTATPTIILDNSTEGERQANFYILPDAALRYLSEQELLELPPQVLRYARNEIYARYGRRFDSAELSGWFNQQEWYIGIVSGDVFDERHEEDLFNEYERKNVKLIADVERGRYVLDQEGYSYDPVYTYINQREIVNSSSPRNAKDPFYGIWCAADEGHYEAELYAQQLREDFGFSSARVFLTSDWSNLNPESWYAVSAGVYSSEDEAYNYLGAVQSYYSDAYVKYSGTYIGN